MIRETLNGESAVEYTYDKAENLILTTYPDGTWVSKEYDLLNQVVAETDSSGRTTRYEYYPNGNLYKTTFADGTWVMYTYDNSWRVIAETAQDGSSRTYKYDSMDHVVSTTDPLGNTVHYEYDKSGRLVKETDANGNSTTYGYDANGNCIEKVNALGVRCTMTYDALNRMTAAAVHTSEGEYSVSYEYDSLGRVVSSTDEEGNTSHMEYDVMGNLLRVIDPKGNVTEVNSYDALNRVTHTEDALGRTMDYSYDGLGNLITAVESLNAEAAAKNADSTRTTSYTYDVMGRITGATDPEEGKTAQIYDGAGNVSSITDANGGTSRYTYDIMGRVLTATSAIGSKTSYTYNAEGLLQELRDARGESTSYTYDLAGRVTSMTDDLGTVSYTYDKNGNVLTVTDGGGSLRYRYDALNRVTSYTDYNGRTVKYSYDELGNLVALTYPGGQIVRYTYYKNGYVHTVTDTEGEVTEYSYDPCGRLTETVRPNGITEQCYYDAAGRPVIRKEVRGSEVISSYSYTYDGWGNLTEIASEETGGDTDGANDGASDGAGIDILSDAIMEYDADNRLISYNGQEVAYDAVGNMTYGPLDGRMQHLTYDCRNRLISAGGITYTYDPANNRIGMETADYREEYVVDSVSSSLSRVLVTYTYDKTSGNSASGEGTEDAKPTETLYTYGQGLISHTADYRTTYYHYNNLGSTTRLTDEVGNTLERYTYGPYGELLSGDTSLTRFLYNGRCGVTTDDNSLYYMRQRYYNPEIKRFINQDILTGNIGSSQSMNRYCYVQGNPISYTDPFGLYPSFGNTYGWVIVHCVLGLLGCIPGPIGMIANGIDAIIYAVVDHDYVSAGLALLGCISCGAATIATKAAQMARVAGKTAEAIRTARMIACAATMVYHGADMAAAGINMGRAYNAIQQKQANGEDVTFADWLPVIMSGMSFVGSASGFVGAGKCLAQETNALQRAKTALSDSAVVKGLKQLWNDNSGSAFRSADDVLGISYGKSSGCSAYQSGRYSVGDATFMDANDAFVSNISRRTDVDANGYFDVIAHGTPNGIQITHNGQHMIVDHRTAARLIQNSDGYNGQAIRLLSCNTGALDNGFAQNLANKLNVEVYAPTNYLWSTPNGNYFVAGMNNSRLPDMNDVGTFKLFSPGGK